MAGSRMSAVSAILGALALHFTGLGASWLQVPTALAAWGWQLSAGPGFTCAGQTSPIGCTASEVCTTPNVTCDVVPDEGYECNATTTQIMCQHDQPPDSPVFLAPGSQRCTTASNHSTIFWGPSVSCMKTPASRAIHPHDQDTVHFIQVPSADAKGSEL
mmetsp:Transcript_87873/g.223665  ORF Transcript_87873/g.223665 Transcript_87873/m.223665 type:complete len:159 (-) Transcript_87873:190-666(-)